jgi:hypothetical protein
MNWKMLNPLAWIERRKQMRRAVEEGNLRAWFAAKYWKLQGIT